MPDRIAADDSQESRLSSRAVVKDDNAVLDRDRYEFITLVGGGILSQ